MLLCCCRKWGSPSAAERLQHSGDCPSVSGKYLDRDIK